jgi:anti-sigma B factor antagonist
MSPSREVDAFTVSQLREALAGLVHSQYVVLDLSKVTFIDSAGIGALVGGIRWTRELGGEIAFACNRPVLQRLLHSTGLDRIVTVAPDPPTATLEFAHPQPAA